MLVVTSKQSHFPLPGFEPGLHLGVTTIITEF